MKSLTIKYLGGLLCLFLSLSQSTTAQINVSGFITDQQNEAVSYVNVLLINSVDSSLVLGNITDETGAYVLSAVQPGNYKVLASMIGFSDFYSEPFDVNAIDELYTIPTIILQEDASLLDEVEVVEKRALFEQKIDRLVVNVDNSITLSGSTALEVLKRSPGVMVNQQSNSISMSGKDGVVVMMNGKISRMPADAVVQLLGGMSADNIEKIELIHTPPSNYDAEGNAGFINIVLKKSQDEGINGGFSVNAGYGKKEKAGASINLNFRKNKVNIFGDYSWKYNNNPQVFSNYRRFENNGTFFENSAESQRDPTRTHVQNARLGLDVNLSSKTIVGVLVSWADRYWGMEAINSVQRLEDGMLIERLSIPNDEISNDQNYLGNLNLQHQFSESQRLNIDLDYTYFYNDNPSNYLNKFYNPAGELTKESALRVSKKTPLNIWVGKVDYTQNIGKTFIWELGVKAAVTTFDNTVLVEDLIVGEWIKAPFFSSEATMTENIAAAYSALLWKWNNNTDIKFGLRYEYADINLGTVEEPDIVDRERGRLFPSVFVTNKIDEAKKLQFSYSRRIDRPSFKQLAPWFIFLDPSTVTTGNPTLQASISDAFRGSYSWKTLQVSAQYTYTQNLIGRFQPSVDLETNTQIDGAKNFENAHLASASISFPLRIKDWWEIRSGWTGQWTKVNDEIEGKKIDFTNTSWYMNGSSVFKLPNKIAIEISGNYFSKSLGGAVIWEDFNNLDIGIQKEFNNNHGTLKFAVNNLFKSGNWKGKLDDPDVDFVYQGFFGFAERVYRVTYSKRFGNNKLKGQRKRVTGSAEEQRRLN